jgi:O-antigen/teichoic acid export membrane protein
MLGIWAENTDVSRYAIAWRTATLISFVLFAVNTIAQPKFAELHARNDMQALAATAHRATLLMTVFAAPVFLILLAAPGYIMSVFGSDFSAGATTLQILSVGQFINVVAGSVGVLLVMSGHERDFRNVQIIVAIVVLTLNVMLIPRYGDVGAALAAASALIVQNVLFGYFVWIRLGILMINPRSVIQRSVSDV